MRKIKVKETKVKTEQYDFSFRCPRCNGFLQNADKLYAPVSPDFVVAKNGRIIKKAPPKMYLCINCGRIWMHEKNQFFYYPTGQPAEEVILKPIVAIF